MCGRKTLTKNERSIIEELMVDEWRADGYEPSYNIAPTQYSPIMVNEKQSKVVTMMRWGLIPKWSTNDAFSSKMINARCETLSDKPSYKDLVYQNRCIVLADGYYEWKKSNKEKIPYYIHHQEGQLLLVAGLWTIWHARSKPLLTYTIITTKAQKDIFHIHDRMPLILEPSNIGRWLKGGNERFNVNDHIQTSQIRLDHYPVRSLVNYPSNNSKRCIAPSKSSDSLDLFSS